MSLSLYEAALASSHGLGLRFDDGRLLEVDVPRWRGHLDAADKELLARAAGPVLDVGCGPGRLGAALARRGVESLGIDVSATAVRMARQRGGAALQGDVFRFVPDVGSWSSVLLIDGNVGIGGDPARLLRRCRELLSPDGSVHVEVGPPGSRSGSSRVRLECAISAGVGDWFHWGWLADEAADPLATQVGLVVNDRWHCESRYFVTMSVAAPGGHVG